MHPLTHELKNREQSKAAATALAAVTIAIRQGQTPEQALREAQKAAHAALCRFSPKPKHPLEGLL